MHRRELRHCGRDFDVLCRCNSPACGLTLTQRVRCRCAAIGAPTSRALDLCELQAAAVTETRQYQGIGKSTRVAKVRVPDRSVLLLAAIDSRAPLRGVQANAAVAALRRLKEFVPGLAYRCAEISHVPVSEPVMNGAAELAKFRRHGLSGRLRTSNGANGAR